MDVDISSCTAILQLAYLLVTSYRKSTWPAVLDFFAQSFSLAQQHFIVGRQLRAGVYIVFVTLCASSIWLITPSDRITALAL